MNIHCSHFVCLAAKALHLCLCMAVTCGPGLADERRVQPDILLVMPDQMRGDCLSILGHPAVRTPQMDQLAREGVLFRRAYSTVP